MKNEVMKESGRINNEGHIEVNMSSIYTFILKQAAKATFYASDILYDIKAVEEFIDDPSDDRTFWFGFRDMGVDGETFIKSRGVNSTEYINGIYTLTFTKNNNEYDITLDRIAGPVTEKEQLYNMAKRAMAAEDKLFHLEYKTA